MASEVSGTSGEKSKEYVNVTQADNLFRDNRGVYSTFRYNYKLMKNFYPNSLGTVSRHKNVVAVIWIEKCRNEP